MGWVTVAPFFKRGALAWLGGASWEGGVGVLPALASEATVFSRAVSLLWMLENSLEGVPGVGATGRMALVRGSLKKRFRIWAVAAISARGCLTGCRVLRSLFPISSLYQTVVHDRLPVGLACMTCTGVSSRTGRMTTMTTFTFTIPLHYDAFYDALYSIMTSLASSYLRPEIHYCTMTSRLSCRI